MGFKSMIYMLDMLIVMCDFYHFTFWKQYHQKNVKR